MEENYNNQDDRYRYYSSQSDDSRRSYGTSGYRYQPDTGRYESNGEQEMGVGKWLLTFLICMDPGGQYHHADRMGCWQCPGEQRQEELGESQTDLGGDHDSCLCPFWCTRLERLLCSV